MLVSLHVKNLALIQEAEVYFQEGMNILTGETGAGKSILIGSVGMALGGKVSKDMIRTQSDYACAELVFEAEDEALEALAAMELYPLDGERQFVFSRRLSGGRSICKINGETCSAAVLQRAGALLLDICGQHEHQGLTQRKRQLEILDAYGGGELAAVKAQVSGLYGRYAALRRELEEETMDAQARAREISFAQFEIQEIEEARLAPGEDEELEAQYRRLLNSRRILEAVSAVYQETGYGSMAGAGESVGRAVRQLAGAAEYDGQLEGLAEQLASIDGLLNDFNRELQEYARQLEFAGDRFAEVEERLNEINRLKDKYGSTVEEILEYKSQKEERLERLLTYEESRRQKEEELAGLNDRLADFCGRLSALRASAAGQLSEKIGEALRELNFERVAFEIRLERTESCGPDGMDAAEFYISTNPGEPVKPMKDVASGGELSRIMLAVKSVLADRDAVHTLIFDEIDAGISGRTAQKVSEKLSVIAGEHQVICITHLPQIASMADTHFLIEKHVENDGTATTIRQLSREEEVEELARMLGGVKITGAVLENAREMKELADRTKIPRVK